MIWLELAGAILIPVVRNISGWLCNALEDNEISDYEWRQLGITIFQVGVPAAAIYLGFNSAGIDVGLIGAACGGLIVDLVRSALRKGKK